MDKTLIRYVSVATAASFMLLATSPATIAQRIPPRPTPTPTVTPVATPTPVQVIETETFRELPTLVRPNVNNLNPVDQNQGITGITLIHRLTDQLKPLSAKGLIGFPDGFFVVGNSFTSNPAFDEAPPAGAKVLDTDATWQSSEHLLPIAYFQPTAPSTIPPYVIQVGKTRSHLVMFQRDGQTISGAIFGAKGTNLIGSEGTVVTGSGGILSLQTGDLGISTGSTPVRVATVAAGIKVEGHATAQFSYIPEDAFSVVNYSSAHTKGAEVKVRASGAPEAVVSLAPGEGASSTNSGRKLDRFTADSKAQLHAGATGGPIRIWAEPGTQFMPAAGCIRLFSGEMLVDAPPGFQIQTAMGTIFTNQESVIRVERRRGLWRIQCATGADGAYIISGKNKIPLERSEEVLLTDHKPLQEEGLPPDGIGRRSFNMLDLSNGLTAVFSDFSIFAMLHGPDYLKPLRHPANSADRSMRAHILHTCAAVEYATGVRGGYYTNQRKEASAAPQSPSM